VQGRPLVREIQDAIRHPVKEEQVSFLSRSVTDLEIRDILFSLARDKALGPDGFSVEFFKHNCEIVGQLVTAAAKDFFTTSNFLREINNTILALVPKVPNAITVSDYMLVTCCNTIYKYITKVLVNRVAVVLQDVISHFQSAFVKGWRIRDHILMA